MKLIPTLSFCVFTCSVFALEIDDYVDRLDNALTFAALQENVRARLSGMVDLELYHFQQPAPGVIDSNIDTLFNPRLTLFLDAQLGSPLYFFAEARLDRQFDPSNRGAQARLDEYALRLTPWQDGRFNIQFGKFATVVGNWVPRHLSWDNPLINAPLVYENVTGISDKAAPVSPKDFVRGFEPADKSEYNPVIWGPSYASGVSVSGRFGQFDYGAELKNSALASRPQSWSLSEINFDNPAYSGRIGFRPSQMWNFGVSASNGAYFRPEAQSTLPHGRDIDDYRELVVGEDASFAWHHLQLWAEFYEARFQVPRVGDADTFACYFEGKYKFTPQLFGALRWNQQLFGSVSNGAGGNMRWGHNLGRVDIAGGYRFTPHSQLKLQYSFQHETTGAREDNHLFAAQFTIRF
jgi:hypothetical protein